MTFELVFTFPRPIKCDGNGKATKDYSPRDWLLKVQEEIFEVAEIQNYGNFQGYPAQAREMLAEELADVITVCISWLDALGYDNKKRAELFVKVNEKNEKRGYFKER